MGTSQAAGHSLTLSPHSATLITKPWGLGEVSVRGWSGPEARSMHSMHLPGTNEQRGLVWMRWRTRLRRSSMTMMMTMTTRRARVMGSNGATAC